MRMASRRARWYSPLMSIQTARIDARRLPSSVKKACQVALLRPFRTHTIRPVSWSATTVRYDIRRVLAPGGTPTQLGDALAHYGRARRRHVSCEVARRGVW
jgi:hypothetical protein